MLLPTVEMKLVGRLLVSILVTLVCLGRLFKVMLVCLTKPTTCLHVVRVLISVRLDYLSTEWHRMELSVQCIIYVERLVSISGMDRLAFSDPDTPLFPVAIYVERT